MPVPDFPQDWDFYEGAAESGRAFVTLNLGLKGHVPLKSHPVRVQLRVKMQQPRADGLRSPEEAPALFAFEDKLVGALTSSCDALFAARVVAYGYSEFFFYVPLAQRDCGAQAERLMGGAAPYHLQWFDEDDPDWTEYVALYPNRYAMQTIANRRLQQQMEENGDLLHVPRDIDHGAVFPTKERALEAAQQLSAAGFRVGEPSAPSKDGAGWFLEFHKVERCDEGHPDRFVFEVLDLITPLDGDYDGWGSVLQRAQA